MTQKKEYVNTIFSAEDYARLDLRGRQYDSCTFEGCDFSETNLTGVIFTDCVFDSCRMTLAVLTDTVLQRVVFRKSDLRGINFETVSDFGFGFTCEGSRLDNCSFIRQKISGTLFRGGELRECYFAACDLTDAVFDECLMADTTFEQCNLSGADLRTAIGYVIDPRENRVAKARFSEHNLVGLAIPFGVRIE